LQFVRSSLFKVKCANVRFRRSTQQNSCDPYAFLQICQA
jgi:hypothetical protein